MSNPPAFQFYPKQWLGDDMVALMDLSAQGAHLRLMCFAWQQSPACTLPNDLAVLSKWCGMSAEAFAPVWAQVQMAWNFRNDRWLSVGLQREYRKQKEYSKKQSTRASNGWKTRLNQDDATALPRQSHGNAQRHDSGNALQSSSSSSSSKVKDLTPLPPSGGADAAKPKARKAKPESRVEFWQTVVDHVNRSWQQRKGTPYPWDPHEFKKLHRLSVIYQAWGMMAMWDLYVQMGTYWGKLTGFMLDGLKKDVGVIVDDPRWKSLCRTYEEKLFAPSVDDVVGTKDVLKHLVATSKSIP